MTISGNVETIAERLAVIATIAATIAMTLATIMGNIEMVTGRAAAIMADGEVTGGSLVEVPLGKHVVSKRLELGYGELFYGPLYLGRQFLSSVLVIRVSAGGKSVCLHQSVRNSVLSNMLYVLPP